jgi:hypothetical protein
MKSKTVAAAAAVGLGAVYAGVFRAATATAVPMDFDRAAST